MQMEACGGVVAASFEGDAVGDDGMGGYVKGREQVAAVNPFKALLHFFQSSSLLGTCQYW